MTGPSRLWSLATILLRTYGWRGVSGRANHEMRRRASLFKRTPAVARITGPRDDRPIYRPHQDLRALAGERRLRAVERGRKVLDGWYEAFGYEWRRLPDRADAWQCHPQTGFRFPDVDWWRVAHLPAGTDIKDVWEPGRFGWVYDLVRAYVITEDPSYAQHFHARLAAWQQANPPFRGVHWSCGQETAIRALALLFAADTLPLPDAEPDRARERLWSMLGWSGERIADAIGYGLSQRNNHGVSEAAGLIHLGLRLDGVHPDARRWVARGLRSIAQQIRDQFSADGWYAQHSFTYTRVALEQSLLAQWALQLAGQSLPADCLERLGSGAALLTELIAAENGIVPNHGHNDGARIAPLSTADYRDFRPVLTLASVVLGFAVPSDIALDEDVLRWFGQTPPAAAAPRADGVFSGPSGWAVARVKETSVFLRAGKYIHRPAHMDLLHIDVRIGGAEIVTDAGTSTYNGPALWRNGLVSAVAHNGPVLDDQEPAVRGPGFLWLTWPEAALLRCEYREGSATLAAEIPGRVRRVVEVTAASVTVRDQLIDPSVRAVQVTWLLGPAPRRATLAVADAQVLEAKADRALAWWCPTYGHCLPSQALQVRRDRRSDPRDIVTVIHRSMQAVA